MIVLQQRIADPCVNLALEEVLLQQSHDDYFLLWQNFPTVLIGRHQDADDEVDLSLAKSLNIPVVRRISGGGAVYHDSGTINFSFITDCKYSAENLLQHVLSYFSVQTVTTRRNDVLVQGKKVMGTARYQVGTRTFVSCVTTF